MGKKKVNKKANKKLPNGVEYQDATLPLSVRVESWMGRHFKHVFVASVALALITTTWHGCEIRRMSRAIEMQAKTISDLEGKVVFVTPDGRVSIVEKQPITASTLLYYLRGIVYKDLIISGFDLQYNGITDSKKMYTLQKVRDFLPFVLSDRVPPKEVDLILRGVKPPPSDLKYYTKAGRSYLAFLDVLFNEYVSGTLPEVIYAQGVKAGSEKILYQDGKFSYSVEIPVFMQYVKNSMWQTGVGVIRFSFKGEIDLKDGTPYNPFGIKLTGFQAVYVKKPEK